MRRFLVQTERKVLATGIRSVATRCSLRVGSRITARTLVSTVSASQRSSLSVVRRLFATAAPAQSGGTTDFLLADIGEGIAEVEIMKWYVKPGDKIKQFDNVCQVQSDKATVDITSRYDGVVKELKYAEKQIAKVGKPLLTIAVEGAVDSAPTPSKSAPSPASATAPKATPAVSSFSDAPIGGKVLASPAVRRLAKENNINLSHVTPTGPKNNITKDDMLTFIQTGGASSRSGSSGVSAGAVASSKPKKPVQYPGTTGYSIFPPYSAQDQTVAVTGLQRIMVQTMTASNAVPSLGYADEIVMDRLVQQRAELKNWADENNIKLSYLPFILKATSLSLLKFPMLNAHIASDGSQVVQKGSHNIGFAMDTPRGLLVPNIKNVQKRSILDIAKELQRLSDLGAQAKLGKEDLTGGTFTISNVGTIGGTYTRPLIVVPEVVIGALGKFQTLPRFDAKMNVVPTTIMVASWTADHRVIDGATVARFSNVWKHYLENPSTLLMEGGK